MAGSRILGLDNGVAIAAYFYLVSNNFLGLIL